jgi:hypothetical protein
VLACAEDAAVHCKQRHGDLVFHAEMTCSNCGDMRPGAGRPGVPAPGDLDRLMDVGGKEDR